MISETSLDDDRLDDDRLAERLASSAGRHLVALRARLFADGAAAAAVKTEGDRSAHELLMSELAALRPGDEVLSEEADDTPDAASRRQAAERVWIIDPLDGTREFSEPGRTDWAVHVALTVGGVPVAGAVALPALGVTYSTADPPVVPPPAPGRRRRVVVSRTRPAQQAQFFADELDADLVGMGSAGAKAMAVVTGDADAYPHAGGQYEWDSCAPVAVASAAGLWCSRLDGSPLRYNAPDPYIFDLLICRPELAPAIIAAAGRFG